MENLPFKLEDSLVDNPPKIFSSVKYCLEGQLHPKIAKLLENGGAKQVSYPTISATHMMVGEGADDVKVDEAKEVFELPLANARWVAFCAKAGKLLPVHGFEPKNILSGLVITTSGIKNVDLKYTWALITYYGGKYKKDLTKNCTHLVTNTTIESPKFRCAKELGVKIVCCDWITDSLKANSLLDETKYHPQFLVKPEPTKKATKGPQTGASEKVTAPKTTAAQSRQTAKVAQQATPSIPPAPPPTSQAQTILQVQLSANQPANGPRGRPVAVRQQSPQVVIPNKSNQPAPTQVRAHRPLLVGTQQQQGSKTKPVPSQQPPIAQPGSGLPPPPLPPMKQTTPPQQSGIAQPTQQNQLQLQTKPPQQQPLSAPAPQVAQQPAQPLPQLSQGTEVEAPLQQQPPQQPQQQPSNQQQQPLGVNHQILQPPPQQHMQPQQSQPPGTQQIQTSMPQQQIPPQLQLSMQAQLQSSIQQQHPLQQQQSMLPQLQSPMQQVQVPSSLQSQLPQQQQTLQNQQQIGSMQSAQHPSQLQQQLQQGQSQLHQQQLLQQQHPQIQLQHPTQLQVALSQQPPQPQQLQSQGMAHAQQQQSAGLQMHIHQQQQHHHTPQQQSVLQNQLQPQVQLQHSQIHGMSMQNQQQVMQPQSQHSQQHHKPLQLPGMSPHPPNQGGLQGHQILQQQQGLQIQRPPSQGHHIHMQQQHQLQGQVHLNSPHQGMQFQQPQQMQQQTMVSQHQQMQMQQQQHNLQQISQGVAGPPQQVLQNSQQVTLQPQKSPLSVATQQLQGMCSNQQQIPIQQQQQNLQVQQVPMSPHGQGLQTQQQQQTYQINQIQNQQQQQQLLQQQQFVLPGPSKTPPQLLHPPLPQHQQLLSQQQQHQLQSQGTMRPPQPLQPGQSPSQSVHFQILQPQNRLQVVMGVPPKPQYQQSGQQSPAPNSPIPISGQQGLFRQQSPHPQLATPTKPQQGQMFHSLQQQQQARPIQQGLIPMNQQQQPQQGPNQQGTHPLQQSQMQPGQPGHVSSPHAQPGNPIHQIQPVLSSQLQPKQFQEIGPAAGQQQQQSGQHYNVVIHQGQQFTQMNPPPPRPVGQIRHPTQLGSPVPGQGQQQVPKVGPFPTGVPQRPVNQWTQQQQLEIYRQIQMDPNIKAKWAQMDPQQRQLLVQKLAQRHREDQLRKEMMIRQQQLNQQNVNMQSPGQGQNVPPGQVPQPTPGSQHLHGSNQTILVQQSMPQGSQSPIPGGDKQISLPQQNSPGFVSQPAPSPLVQSNSPQMNQNVQLGQMPGSPLLGTAPGQPQQMPLQNHPILSQQPTASQKILSPQDASSQKFPTSAGAIQPMQTHSPTHTTVIAGQAQVPQPVSGTIVRTQQVFTPQVAQQGQRMDVQHILVHQGGVQQQSPRFPQHPVILQQQQQQQPHQVVQSQPGTPPQKVTQLQGQQQSAGQTIAGVQQWIPRTPPPQRLGSPSPASPQFTSPRLQSSPDHQQRSSPGVPVWNVRQPSAAGPATPGSPNTAPFVQVVNSKTKTALANLLNNRLQGNSTGTDCSSTTTSTSSTVVVVSSASTTHTMCPPSQIPPVPSSQSHQLPLQHPVTQVNSYGAAAAARTGVVNQSPASIAISPTRTQFYGHEPTFKAPTSGFFIGCVFWPAQPMDSSTYGYFINIFGGELVTEYNSAKVTHVLCVNQKFPEIQQVVRDGKRLVTLHWLSDTCMRKVMAPPFYAMHLPTPFNEENAPLKGQSFSMTGFDADDRDRIIKMIRICGGNFTPYFTKLNSGLISCRTEGSKFAKSREWKVPIVNIQFLNEVLLGSQSCLQMVHSPKYQHFTLEQPFRFDINLAPHLMAAWKTPIRVNNELMEKARKRHVEKPEEDEVAYKRRKLCEAETKQMDYLKELLAGADAVEIKQEEDRKANVENKSPPVVTFTGFCEKFVEYASEKIIALGGHVTNDITEATHLVAWSVVTSKLYSAISQVKYIVGAPWVRDCVKHKRFMDETKYDSSVPIFENYHKITVQDVLKKPDRHLLFRGLTFYLTPGVAGRLRNDIETVIPAAGGQIDKKQKSLLDVRTKARKSPRKYIVLTTVNDFEFLCDFFYQKSAKPLSIFTVLFVYKSIADQKVDLGPLPSKKAALKVEPANSA